MTTTNEPSADARNRLILQLQDVNFRSALSVAPTPVREYVPALVNQLRCAHVDLTAAADTIRDLHRNDMRLTWLMRWVLRHGERSELIPQGDRDLYGQMELRRAIDENMDRETQAALDGLS